ncbi:MAG: VOC family protein [Deltaproteobacteria bacterium]|jgi:methylmalonyl-CoA epimerase|nr:VOC family protein [Deltaproteobacteria bacterium]
MIKGIGHLGIVVKDIEKSLKALSHIVDFSDPSIKEFPEKKMKCAVVKMDGVALEFLQDDSDDGFLGKFNREKGDSIHHFCLLSDNIGKDVEALKEKGVQMMDLEPRVGLRGKKIAFTTPDALNGISIELSEP